ncbi:MAG: alpha/beta hydrolase [Gemmatimonadetes bacterium]|nr:alpha/beta hydrolase [Gemmatimonadota bacterium]
MTTSSRPALRRAGQLPPERWYPANDDRVHARFIEAGGERLRVLEAGPSKGPVVLLLHGWGCSAFTWRHVLPALAHLGHRAIAVDLRGHGLSDKPDEEAAYTTPALVGHVEAVRDALGLAQYAVVGHSMGGVLARELMFRDARRLTGAVFISPAGFGRIRRREMGVLFSPRLVTPVIPLVVTRTAVARSMRHTYGPNAEPSPREIDDYWAPSQFPAFVRASRHLLHVFDWAPPDPSAFRDRDLPPMLAILGTHERLLDGVATEVYLATHVRQARLEVIEGGGHAVHEDSPAQVNALLASFLAPGASSAAR